MSAPDFDSLVRDHADMIRRIASSYEYVPAAADELMQEILLAVWRSLDRFRGESSLRTWIARIAHNVSVSHVRRAMRRPPVDHAEAPELADDSAEPSATLAAYDERAQLLAAIQQLPLGQRQVLSLHLEDFDYGEIADALGISVTNVGARLTRARQALARHLEPSA
ncbi:MAG: RNA polymerase sigma factor [Pseudomonadota bacterium]